ncbi:hypothetical protein AAF712_016738, partial [Marasmius tenuissimus]
ARDLDNITDRFKTRPKSFHVESSSDLDASEENHAIRSRCGIMENAAILKINGHKYWERILTFGEMFQSDPPRSFTFIVADCRCCSDADFASLYSHKRYEAICLRAAQAHTPIILPRYPIHFSPAKFSDMLLKYLIDSPLLQQCVFGSELLAQCQVLFSIVDRCGGRVILPTAKIEEHREKLLDCLETRHSLVEAETLKFRVTSLFDFSGLGWMIPERTRDRIYHNVLSANRDREKLILILTAIFIAGKYLAPNPKVIEALLDLNPGE